MSPLSLEQKRYKIKEVYPHPGWIDKVNRMAANQICAIYNVFRDTGKFDKKKKEKGPVYRQMNLWEFGMKSDGRK